MAARSRSSPREGETRRHPSAQRTGSRTCGNNGFCALPLVFLALAAACTTAPDARTPPASAFEKIVVAGDDHRNGLFDVSVEYGPDGVGWIAYSRVEVPQRVETHLARSTDGGGTWAFIAALNHSTDGVLAAGDRTLRGVWRHETPTLLYDPGDVPERRWKILWERYLAVPPYDAGSSLHGLGWIEMRHAARPDGRWSVATCVLGPVARGCGTDLGTLAPELRQNVFYNELGSIVVGGTIYLSLDASTTASGLGDWPRRRIILIASPDHGASWRYVGPLTTYDDANALGYSVLTGSSLVAEGGRLYLLATPSGAKGLAAKNRAHDGTLIVEFEDIARAKLKRDSRGRLAVLRHVRPERNMGGLSDHDERNTRGGMLFSQIDLRAPPDVFRIYSTRRSVESYVRRP